MVGAATHSQWLVRRWASTRVPDSSNNFETDDSPASRRPRSSSSSSPANRAMQQAKENRSIARYETTAVYTHPEARVDIVLVHGLNGQPDKTWTAKNGVFWPLDLLPASLKDAHANVLVYGYNADVYSRSNNRSASDNFIHQHAQSLVANLTLFRQSEGTFKNPIIWVCHSLGGILTKRALLYSNDVRAEHNEDHRSIYVSTFGIIFLGTPHTGSDAASWGIMLQAMSDAVVLKRFFETESVLLKTLKSDNETLSSINSHFLDIYQRFRIHMAHENHKTDIKGYKTIIVDSNSASPQLPGVTYYGIEATHSGMCKFDSANAPGYRNVSTVIQKWIYRAPAVIQVRWDVEEEEKRARARNEIAERISPFMSVSSIQPRQPVEYETLSSIKDQTTTTPLLLDRAESFTPAFGEPLFIHPEGFRPNSSFKGRDRELLQLHEMLMDEGRREQGTSAVLIWSIPGGGKSHLARQYLFDHIHDYPGGVFWVRAKSPEELEETFMKIARHSLVREGLRVNDEADLRDPHKVVRLVRRWLNRSEDWLLILDGVLSDTHGISRYIPDAKNTSLIITSTDSSIEGSHKFDNPQRLELGPLEERDAQEMLLEEMGKKKPWSPDDLSKALEAVKMMDCFPVEIHAAAGQLRATREPLAKYIRAQKNRPRTGALHAYEAVREKLQERGETAALNLMYLLAFFNGRLPVEMLSYGLKGLDKRTPVRTKDSYGKRSLNKTFTVLLVFALIDRDEMDDIPSAGGNSQETRSSHSMELVDILKIHAFVQNFFLETLKKEGQLEFWLGRAVAVFCASYDSAKTRVEANPEVGLPGDYRRYAAHCRKILDHIDRVDKPTPELRDAKRELEGRLGDIQGQMATLNQFLKGGHTDNDGVLPHMSVFERTNSWSASSTTTATSKEGGGPSRRRTFPDPHDESPSMEFSPHRFHRPYPTTDLIPGPGFVDDEEGEGEGEGEWEWAVLSPETSSLNTLEPHRTLRKMAARRYHDRPGAWRETTLPVAEPRSSLSTEMAHGSFSPPAQGNDAPDYFPKAEQRLHRLKKSNQRVYSMGSFFNAETQDPTPSKTVKSPSPHNSPKSTPMSRVDSKKEASRHSIPPRGNNPFFEVSNSDGIPVASEPFETSEWVPTPPSGNVSKRNHSDTCLEDDVGSWPPAGLPIAEYSTSSLGPPNSGSMRRPRHRPTSPPQGEEMLSNSFPSSHTSTLHPPAWRPVSAHPDGYTSQPMSRDVSSSTPELTRTRHSSPSPSRSNATSPTLPIKTGRAPSMTATEPSPRMHNLDNIQTSYSAWQQRHVGPWSPVSTGSSPPRHSVFEGFAGEATEMERSGSGGIRYAGGKIVPFGKSPPKIAPYPREIVESDEEMTGARGKPVGLGIVNEETQEKRRKR